MIGVKQVAVSVRQQVSTAAMSSTCLSVPHVPQRNTPNPTAESVFRGQALPLTLVSACLQGEIIEVRSQNSKAKSLPLITRMKLALPEWRREHLS